MKENFMLKENREKECEYIQIEVEDNGPGIAIDKLPYLFQRFYQVNQEKKSPNSGSGIGLAITKDLVDLHHGSIDVKSIENEGSLFTIKLPTGNSHLLPEEIIELKTPTLVTEEELNNDEKDTSILKNNKLCDKKTVLIVDDNPDIRTVVKTGLLNKYQVIEASNGKSALYIALKEMPDIIVSDVLMPEMDGIEFCDKLKNNIRTSHIPVILLTTLNAVEHRIKGLESGAEAYMPKPFSMKLLALRVDKLIETRESMMKRFQTEAQITPSKINFNSLDKEFLGKIMELMESNMSNETYWLDELANDMNISKSTFFRKLKKLTGQPPNDFMRMIRLKRATQLLEQNQFTISEISYKVGFNDPSYFSKCFRKNYGYPPSQYAKKKHD